MRRVMLLSGTLVISVSASSIAVALPPHSAPAITAQVAGVTDGSALRATILSVGLGAIPASSQTDSAASTLAEWANVVAQYIGIDTPAPSASFGPEAKAANEAMIEGRIVYPELDSTLWSAAESRLLAWV
jgi:hypothetical protein